MSSGSLMMVGFLLLLGILTVEPAKILFLFPHPATSHYLAYSPLLKELAKMGHQISAYTKIRGEKSSKNFHHISIQSNDSPPPEDTFNQRSESVISFLHGELWNRWLINTVEAALESNELQALMHSEENFDLLMVEPLFVTECILAFSHKFNVPVVALYPIFAHPLIAQSAGIPHTFSYIPSTFLPFSYRMNFWQRTKNALIGMYEITAWNFYYLPIQERLMRKHFKYPGSENLPPLEELISNISLHLINSHQLMGSVRPYTPNVVEVAGMNIKTSGKLPKDLQKFMDEATEGVIYFSFGTSIRPHLLSKHFKDVLIETLKDVKQRVIMKWNGTIEGAPHILTKEWLPQLEILAHPNCKLFITHGGFNGLMEAMVKGVPTIGIPFFADQFRNVAWYEHNGVGLEVDYESITVAEFTEKIENVLLAPSFRENAKKIAALYQDEPQSSLEKAVFWVEYVIRHKGAHHLKPASLKMPYYQYLLLDVIAFLVVSTFVSAYTIYYLFCMLMTRFAGAHDVSEKKAKKQK